MAAVFEKVAIEVEDEDEETLLTERIPSPFRKGKVAVAVGASLLIAVGMWAVSGSPTAAKTASDSFLQKYEKQLKGKSRKELKSLFSAIDSDGDGFISTSELQNFADEKWPDMANKKAVESAQSLEAGANGLVARKKFKKMLSKLNLYNDISKVFDSLDTDADNKVDSSEFVAGASTLGFDNLSDDELTTEYQKIDANNGDIQFDEFVRAAIDGTVEVPHTDFSFNIE